MTKGVSILRFQYHLLKLISRVVCVLPYGLVQSIGKAAGHLYCRIAAKQRKRAVDRMKKSFAYSSEQAEAIVSSMFIHLGRTFMEILYTPNLTVDNIGEYVEMEHKEYLTEALTGKKGVVILTAHFGNWEWLGAALALNGFPLAAVIKRQPNDQHTRILNEFREKAGIEVFARGTTELIGAARVLKKGKMLGFLADQDAGPKGVFVPFLGQMAATPLGPTFFAKKFGSAVVPAFIVRKPDGHHKVILQRAFHFQDTGNEEQAIRDFTLKLNRIIENMIEAYPDQWMWFQKRWNTPYIPAKAGGLEC